MYQVGMYGGSFNPLHQGHVKCIIEAASQCRELHIIISNGTGRREADIRIKYRWIYQIVKHMGNVILHVLDDDTDCKENYTKDKWIVDSLKVKEMIGKPIDVIFCGSDYDENSFYGVCYPESQRIYFQRDEISSTKIRLNPFAYWDWIPQPVRPFYVKKILLIGSESVGKSTLTIHLAHYYNTNFLEEVGREVSEQSGTDEYMLSRDFTEILLKHKLKEMELVKSSNKFLFIDTDCLITKFFIRFLDDSKEEKQKNEKLADAISLVNHYDLVLFLEPDVEFVQEGGRSEIIKEERVRYSNQIKEIFLEQNILFTCIKGDYYHRFLEAVKIIDQRFPFHIEMD